MKKRFKHKRLLTAPQDEPAAAGLIYKIQQQLSAIDKKLDILISQPSKRPFEKNYSQKPFRRFNHPHRYDRGRQGDEPRERTYTRVICVDCKKECEIPFKPSGGRPVYCKECFSKRNKSSRFNLNRDSTPEGRDFFRKRRFDKSHAEKRQKPFKKKKPFFTRRKKRA